MRYATLWTIERTKTTGSGRAASILDDRGVLTRVERRLTQASFNIGEGVWELEQSSNVRPLHKGRGGEDSDETCKDFEGHAGGPGAVERCLSPWPGDCSALYIGGKSSMANVLSCRR